MICERSPTVLLAGWKFMNHLFTSPSRPESLFIKIDILPKYFNVNIDFNVKKYKNEKDQNQHFKNAF